MDGSAYASVADYERRFGEVADEGMLAECLADASAAIDAELVSDGQDPDAADPDALMRVCRSMANRVMPPPDGGTDAWGVPVGATQVSRTAGSYSVGYSLQPTYGTPRMLDSERALLGIGRTLVGFVPVAGGRRRRGG